MLELFLKNIVGILEQTRLQTSSTILTMQRFSHRFKPFLITNCGQTFVGKKMFACRSLMNLYSKHWSITFGLKYKKIVAHLLELLDFWPE